MSDRRHERGAGPEISPELLAAYAAANYQVDLPSGQITLKVGEGFYPPDGFAGVRLAVVTAANPFSRRLSDAENAERHADLVQSAKALGLSWFPAAGVDPTGQWPSEVSLAVVDATDAQLDDWMGRFGQNAVVVADVGRPINLKLNNQLLLQASLGRHFSGDQS